MYVVVTTLERLGAFLARWRRRMYRFPLKDIAVWYVDEDVEKRLRNSYALNEQRKSVGRSLEAIDRDKAAGVEEAERDDVMQANYAETDEVKLRFRSPNHGGLLAAAVRTI